MPVLAAATLELNADSAKLEADMGRAVAQGAALGTALGEAIGKGIGRAADYLVNLTRNAINAGEEVLKLGQKLGLTAEETSQYVVAAKLADVSTGTLGQSFRELA